jgi:hypothetical protein
MTEIAFPKEDVTRAIREAIVIIRKLKINYIQFPSSFLPYKSEYLNWKQATRIEWIKQIKVTFAEELILILKLEEIELLTKEEKMSLQAKCLRRIHEALSKILLMSKMPDDDHYLSIVLENLYTLGKGYKYAPSQVTAKFKEQYEEEQSMSKALFSKNSIPIYKIEDSGKYKKFENVLIPEKIQIEEIYETLNTITGLPISGIKIYTQKDVYYKYILLSEYSHAKSYYSFLIKGLSNQLPLLFAHELCLIALEYLSFIFKNQEKEIKLWIDSFPKISKDYGEYWKVSQNIK